MRLTLLLFLILASSGPLSAQAESGSSTPGRVRATGTLALKGSQIADQHRLHLGGWAGLVFTENLAIGGGGFALLNQVELAGSEGGTGFRLDLGYGGLFFRYWEPVYGNLMGEVGLLLGAGHSEVRDRLTGSEVGADNFLVAEAELGAAYALLPGIHLVASLGYRLTSGVEDLPGVPTGDLNAFTGTLSFRLGGG